MSAPTIVELVALCERAAAVNRDLFAVLGDWVADEPDPALQRWFAVACHRHAWHAQLWSDRRPAIPIDAPADAPTARSPVGDDRAGWYEDRLAEMVDELTVLDGRIDPLLDPSTLRVVRLVAADLTDLRRARPT